MKKKFRHNISEGSYRFRMWGKRPVVWSLNAAQEVSEQWSVLGLQEGPSAAGPQPALVYLIWTSESRIKASESCSSWAKQEVGHTWSASETSPSVPLTAAKLLSNTLNKSPQLKHKKQIQKAQTGFSGRLDFSYLVTLWHTLFLINTWKSFSKRTSMLSHCSINTPPTSLFFFVHTFFSIPTLRWAPVPAIR